MKHLPSLRISTVTAIVTACVAISACGGGSGGDSAPSSSVSVVPSGESASQQAAAASSPEASASSAAAAASATVAAAEDTASAPAAAAAPESKQAQASATPSKPSTASTGTKTETAAAGNNTSLGVVVAAPGSGSQSSSTASTSEVSTQAPAAAAEEPRAKAMAETVTTGARCTVGETRTFGACKALASIGISHGETVSFWNTNAGVTGSIAARCSNGVVTWQPGVCSSTTAPATTTTTTTTMNMAKVSSVVQQTAIAAPTLSALQTFVATPPFSVQTLSGLKPVPLIPYGAKIEVPRTHDFVSAFVNPLNQRPNAVTVQTPVVANGVLQYINLHEASTPPLTASGSAGRAFIESGALKLAYLPYDPPSTEKLRTQVNSYSIPTRRTLTWDLSFKFGGDKVGEAWPTVKYTSSPVLIWQVIQSTRGYPPMVLMVDTDPADSNKLLLILAWRSTNTVAYTNRWTVASLAKNQYHDLVIQANLDERETAAGGRGQLRMWINGQLAADLNQRTLFPDLDDTYRWVVALYQTNEPVAIPLTRVMKWRRARMMVAP